MLRMNSDINRILYICIAHIGDIVLSIPPLKALKRHFPNANIDILVSFPQGEIAFYIPYIHEVLEYDAHNWRQDRRKLLHIITKLRKKKYDIAISCKYGSAGPMLALLSGARIRIGYAGDFETKFLTHPVYTSKNSIEHEIYKQLAILEPLGITCTDTTIDLAISPENNISLLQKLNLTSIPLRPIILLCPFSSQPQKDWSINSSADVMKKLAENYDIYLIGTLDKKYELETIVALSNTKSIVLAGVLTIGELGALINIATVLITVDTGPMHIAQAFKTSVIALFGPTNPSIWGPRKNNDIILYKPLPCSPCWHCNEYYKQNCTNNICLQEITALDVITAVKKVLL